MFYIAFGPHSLKKKPKMSIIIAYHFIKNIIFLSKFNNDNYPEYVHLLLKTKQDKEMYSNVCLLKKQKAHTKVSILNLVYKLYYVEICSLQRENLVHFDV